MFLSFFTSPKEGHHIGSGGPSVEMKSIGKYRKVCEMSLYSLKEIIS